MSGKALAWNGGMQKDMEFHRCLGNYVDSDVRIYVSEDNYFTMSFTLNYNTEYDDKLEKYIQLDYLRPQK